MERSDGLAETKRRLPDDGGFSRRVCDLDSVAIEAVIVTSRAEVEAHPASVKVAWTVPFGKVVALDVIVALPCGQVEENATVTGCGGGAPAASVTVTAIDAVP
jgi:hypothetical protein